MSVVHDERPRCDTCLMIGTRPFRRPEYFRRHHVPLIFSFRRGGTPLPLFADPEQISCATAVEGSATNGSKFLNICTWTYARSYFPRCIVANSQEAHFVFSPPIVFALENHARVFRRLICPFAEDRPAGILENRGTLISVRSVLADVCKSEYFLLGPGRGIICGRMYSFFVFHGVFRGADERKLCTSHRVCYMKIWFFV